VDGENSQKKSTPKKTKQKGKIKRGLAGPRGGCAGTIGLTEEGLGRNACVVRGKKK